MKISIFAFLFAAAALGISVFQYNHFLHIHPPIEKQLQEINIEILKLKKTIHENKVLSSMPVAIPLTLPVVSLNEISAIIHLSTLQLEYAHDPKSASRLLSLADKKIETIHDNRLMALRNAIIQDRSALDAIQLPDTEGVWMKLGVLIAQTEQFPSRWTIFDKEQDKTKQNTAKTEWKNGWNELKDFIKIQHHDTAITPLLSADEQALSKKHVQLLLEQARFSVLNVKPMVYKTSLQEAQQWLTRYFAPNSVEVKNAINTLHDLESVPLQTTLPNLNQTLEQLDQLKISP